MAYGDGNRSGWALGLPILGVLAFGVRLLAVCGRSGSSYTPSYNYNPPTLPGNIDYSALLGLDASAAGRVTGGNETEPDAIAFDATNVYVADAKERALYAIPKSGGARKMLTRTAGAVHAIAVGATDVYFTTVTTTIAGKKSGTLMSVPTRGGIAVPVVPAGTYLPERLSVDARSIFFTSPEDTKATSASVLRVAIGGGAPSILDVDPNAPVAWSVVTDDANVYFTSADGTEIASIAKTGGETKILVPDQMLAHDLVADADTLYWTDGLAGKVLKATKRGGAPVTLATGESNVDGIAVDAGYVYWVSHTSGTKLATIMRASKSGGASRPIAQGLVGVRNVVSDGTRTYWSMSGSVYWVSANDPVAASGGATVHVLAAATTSSIDGGIASRGGAYGTTTGSLGGSSGGPTVIRTFRSKDR
jgi:hypothetical protein